MIKFSNIQGGDSGPVLHVTELRGNKVLLIFVCNCILPTYSDPCTHTVYSLNNPIWQLSCQMLITLLDSLLWVNLLLSNSLVALFFFGGGGDNCICSKGK
jgi:hypothetical protein